MRYPNTYSHLTTIPQLSPGDGARLHFAANPTLGGFDFVNMMFRFSEDLIIQNASIMKLVNGTIGSLEPADLFLVQLQPVDGENWYTGSGQGPAFMEEFLISNNIFFSNTTGVITPIEDLNIRVFTEYMYCYRLQCPTYATNPTQIFMSIELSGARVRDME